MFVCRKNLKCSSRIFTKNYGNIKHEIIFWSIRVVTLEVPNNPLIRVFFLCQNRSSRRLETAFLSFLLFDSYRHLPIVRFSFAFVLSLDTYFTINRRPGTFFFHDFSPPSFPIPIRPVHSFDRTIRYHWFRSRATIVWKLLTILREFYAFWTKKLATFRYRS